MVQVDATRSLTIGKLASAGGVGVETIRFYERQGLLDQPARDGGVRRYGSEHLRRLRFVRQAQSAGFTLGEIKELLELDASQERPRARELATTRIAALNEKIDQLLAARRSLEQLARQCAEGASGPCPILKSFDI